MGSDESKLDTHIYEVSKISPLKKEIEKLEKYKYKLNQDDINLIDDIFNRDEK